MTIDSDPVESGKPPPRGGADLECMLLCPELRPSSLPAFLGLLESFGFRLIGHDPLLLYEDDPVTPVQVSQAHELYDFVEQAGRVRAHRCIANLSGQLVDTQTTLSVVLHLKKRVVVLSIPEDVLWGFDEVKADVDFQKLRTFSNCCKAVAERFAATLGYLGTEGRHPEDMTIDSAQENDVVDESFFSDVRLRELFDWYKDVYTSRWDKPV